VHPGDTVLFYTDGLIERRDLTLDEGTAWLLDQAPRLAAEPLEFCDGLLRSLPGRVEDGVALLAVRLSDRSPAGRADPDFPAARDTPDEVLGRAERFR